MIKKRSHGAIVVEAIQPSGSDRMSRDIFADVRGLVAPSAELRTPVLRQLVRELEEDVGAALGS